MKYRFEISINRYCLNLVHPSFFFQNIETFLLRKNSLSRAITNSKYWQTYIFMLCSGIILQGKYLYNIKSFWLLEPSPKVADVGNREDNKCRLHPQTSCQKYLVDGMRKYFTLGLTLDVVKTLMSKAEGQSKLWGKIRHFRIRSMVLMTTYMGIYRVS